MRALNISIKRKRRYTNFVRVKDTETEGDAIVLHSFKPEWHR